MYNCHCAGGASPDKVDVHFARLPDRFPEGSRVFVVDPMVGTGTYDFGLIQMLSILLNKINLVLKYLSEILCLNILISK